MGMVLKLNFSCPGGAPRRSAAPSCLELRRFGRWVKIPPRRLPEEVFQARPDGRRPQGTHWKDYIFQLFWKSWVFTWKR